MGEWVSINERLPEIGQRVLVTSYGRVCYGVLVSVDGNNGYPIFKLQDSLNERVVCETTVHSKMTTGRIVAWMSLPEPYKNKTCATCIIDGTDACVRGAGRAVDDEACKAYIRGKEQE